jgi:hypothetical protein
VAGLPGAGFDPVRNGDEALRNLVLAQIIEPTSKVDAIRVLAETRVDSASDRTIKRRLPVIAKPQVRQALSANVVLVRGQADGAVGHIDADKWSGGGRCLRNRRRCPCSG